MIDLEDNIWNNLLEKIAEKECTPFLGAGACYGSLPLAKDLAEALADEYKYPFADRGDLMKVAQFAAIKDDPHRAKLRVLKLLREAGPPKYRTPPDFSSADEPHSVLAELGLPVYMTTNYDNFMQLALAGATDPRREACRWHDGLKRLPSSIEGDRAFVPTRANPLVFHLHGYDTDVNSLVLTEDDYLRFLVNIASNHSLLPARIEQAMTASSFLFVGYRLADWNFRLLLQMLRPTPEYISVAVLLPPAPTEPSQSKAQEYLEEYYASLKLKIFWGTAREFAGQLRRRWRSFNNPSSLPNR